MRIYLTLFSLGALSLGIVIFTIVLMIDRGMEFADYKNALVALVGLTSLISNSAMTFYFTKSSKTSRPELKVPGE